MPSPTKTISLHGIVKRTTEKAVQFDLDEADEYVWIPKSEIREPDPDTIEEGQEIDFIIPEWLAETKGLCD